MASLKRRLLKYLIWFKELFRFCPISYSKVDRDNLFLICGHRGSPVNEPENTIPSFERAVREGANSLEVDICITKDNVVILWHDWNPDDLVALLREKGLEPEVAYKPDFPAPFSGFRNKTSELTLQEMRKHFNYIKKGESFPVNAHIPTLKEFIIWLKEKPQVQFVFLDIKVPKDEKELILVILEQLDTYKNEFNLKTNFIVETFFPEVLEIAKSKYPDLNYSLDVEIPPGFIFMPKIHSTIKVAAKNNNNVAIIMRPRQITIASWMTFRRVIWYDVRRRLKLNRTLNTQKIDFLIGCTINDKREMECLIKSGINGMQTDYPRRLKNLANQYNLKAK
ncbi:MAG: glycerophosphodiester phosphodiesterase family protein [Ignavibacterium sp.]|jgi:glycerophosphoryl diester phosphodiesterase|nr:glycerophosphodiester phosphodiesterase family protein [Ignavibacterium sp.]